MNDPISDMLTRIRNANRALLPWVELPHSKIKESIAGILKREGYISDFAIEGKIPRKIKLNLKYQGKKSVIEGLRRISTPGLRRYVRSTDIPRVRGGLGGVIGGAEPDTAMEGAPRAHVLKVGDVGARRGYAGGVGNDQGVAGIEDHAAVGRVRRPGHVQ